MSGCYDNSYDYCNDNYSYDYDCRPRRRHHKRRHHNDCWDYSYCS
ncbi:hypothetical protein [Cryptosporangium phraense]|nr:hypothetical protein [Cryptosporangium phraense]